MLHTADNKWYYYFTAGYTVNCRPLINVKVHSHREIKLKRERVSFHHRVPTRTGKMGRHFPVREKSGNFEQTGKVRENHRKYWKTQGISDKYYFLFFSDI